MEGTLRASIDFVTVTATAGALHESVDRVRKTQVNNLKLQFGRMPTDMLMHLVLWGCWARRRSQLTNATSY